MREHLRFSVVYWHTFRGTGSDPVRRGHDAAPVGRRQRLARQRAEAGAGGVRVHREAGRALFRLPRPRRRAGRERSGRNQPQPRRRRARCSRRSRSAPASSCSGARRICFPIRVSCTARARVATPTSLPLPPRRSRRRWKSRTNLKGEGYVFWGGREGYSDAAQHRPEARTGSPGEIPAPGRRLQEGDRFQGPVLHRAKAQGADQAPVRFRRGGLPEFPARIRSAAALQTEHRNQSRDPGRPHHAARTGSGGRGGRASARLTPTPATSCWAGTPTSSRPTFI